MKKSLLGLLLAAGVMFSMSGCTTMHIGWTVVTKGHKLDDGAMPAYDKMFTSITTYGDPAKAMMIEEKIDDDVSNDDAVEAIKAVAEERNMRITGDVKMFTKEDAKPDEVKHARIISVCSLSTAKIFLNHSRYYGGFMPCRIMLVEYGNGDRYLVSIDLDLAIHGGFPLQEPMASLAAEVKETMDLLVVSGALGDF